MNPNYLQAILDGNTTEAQRLAGLMMPKLPSTTIAEAIETAMPSGLKSLLSHRSQLTSFYDRIESIAPLAAALRVQGRASSRLQDVHDRMQLLQVMLPQAKFAGFVQAMTMPSASLQEQVERISQLLGEPIDGGRPPPDDPSVEAINASAGLLIGDEVVAHVYRRADPYRDAQWWASLSHDAKIQIWVTIVLALILLLPQIPGYINDYREWRDGPETMTKEQGKQVIAATQATKATLADLVALERQSAARNANFQRESIALQRQSAMLLDPLVGRICEVSIATSVRELGPQRKVIHSLNPGDLVLCMAHEGKWLQVAFDESDGERVDGWVRKKHISSDDAR